MENIYENDIHIARSQGASFDYAQDKLTRCARPEPVEGFERSILQQVQDERTSLRNISFSSTHMPDGACTTPHHRR